METLEQIKDRIILMSIEADKVYNKGNRSAATRARKYAQEIKGLLTQFRGEVLNKVSKK